MTSSSLLNGRLLRTTALGVSIAVAAVSAPAFAQDATTDNAEDTANAIVVTAQGRSQLLSDVPVAISAVSAETLQNSGANDIRQLNQVAPSLLVSSTGSEANGSARIRGIGTVGDNPGLESSVPVFIDGVYRSRSGIGLNELGEIDRVEVQRGPQGTLGGRNSSAGLISIYSKKPDFNFGASGEITYGNYDYWRLTGSVTGPITDKVAARLDGVWVKRDGFLRDTTNNTDVNNRDRYFLRGQLLFEPTDALSIRLIADYTYRNEKCCGAIYVDNSVNPYIGNLNNPGVPATATTNNIVKVLNDLGQPLSAFNQGYGRDLSVSAGRSFAGKTKDYGFSGQIDWDLGGATLTSITAYREYRSGQAGDLDYGAVDILYRAPTDDAYRQFHTFTQEVRLQGEAFDGKLDWLVGGFYANEKLTVRDNLRFGDDYGRFANCRIISGGGLAGLYSPTQAGCVAGGIGNLAGVGRNTILAASGASGADIVSAFTALDGLNDLGTINDRYYQNDRNWALFTHNIFHITDKLDLTLGLRYTNDKKRFNASFTNDNTVCTTVQGLVLDDLTSTTSNSTAKALAGALIGLSCQGNSTAELNGVSINSKRGEDKFTGTAILSYKPVDDLLLYASYARGYKAGGFNLDRSALKSPILPFGGQAGAQALAGNLQFDPELVTSYELGAKYSTGPFSAGLTFFRSDFKNFQLNTFNGTVFLVQNINGCSSDLAGGDRDQSKFTGAPNYNAGAAATGVCPTDDVSWGVRAEGFELEASLVPARNFRMTAGLTYAKTKYRANLVGTASGAPLDQALRLLPGSNLSNAPELVATGSVTWTPEIGGSGLTGLVYIDGRMTSDYNTGSDLFPQKAQDGYAIFNARVGVRGPDEKWGIEFWAQNLFNKQYAQVAFNSPFQEGGTSTGTAFADPQYPGGRQLFSQFLAEPRTYGVTLRGKF
ncbi:TonB-dependent receptor [Sphingopyxis terrae]|uniref:Outer membrane receptor proteins, mostly Fe transport n=1 Tax=Sphingopyxis terrae subsp. ummariensis TaxID=429001 RepID=A0A1Y6F0T7_9SPHN|nr:TonB-dependent receptor [Sphingopyxis terrae]PCF92229.1 TonB-dependent receptor [Sphingopyxis terrae subsp. ummariensis]SMQ66093.1 Outer membrane receptor proteins, mostly Fe transport [Sphingopyxis terrae subsp. ummariensis]